MSCNPNITWEIIQNNPDFNWDWGNISKNPNITWEIIKNNPEKDWDWFYMSVNRMNKGKEKYIKDNIQNNIKRRLGKKILSHIFYDDIIEYICDFIKCF